MISVLVLTLNEEINIEQCLSSIPWREDIHVLDSGSEDNTVSLSEAAGAKCHFREFDNYAAQRNYGLGLQFKFDWVLMLDADERMTPELARELEAKVVNGEQDTDLFLVRRKDMYRGRWLRRSSGYPTWFPRIFRAGRVTVARDVNEEYVAVGSTATLSTHLVHYPFNKGMEWWFTRHNIYSSMEAKILLQERRGRTISFRNLISRDPALRRMSLKQIAYRLPSRPLLIFIYLYFVRAGFLDGRAGLDYAKLRFVYEVMIDSKIAEQGVQNIEAPK